MAVTPGSAIRGRAWAALLPALVAAAISTAQESPGTFAETVDVRVVSVDVFVTDKKGRRVSGLGREDFAVFQDGRPVEVTNFSRIVDRARPPAPASAPAGELDAGAEDGAPAGIPDRLTVVIYIDNSTLTPPHRNRVLDEIESFVVEQVRAGVAFMIAVYDPGLKILTPATTDAERAREILARVARMPASGLAMRAERRQAMSQIEDVYVLFRNAGRDPCVDGWEQMIGAIDVYSQSAGSRVRSAQSGLLGLARSLGGVPGRKSMLYLSDGLELRPGIDLYAFLGELCPGREHEMFTYMTRWDETRTVRELAEYANAHQVTLYALETAGLTGYSAASVEFSDRTFTPSPRNDSLRVGNLQSSLFIMAEETGGRAFLNANAPGPDLERMAEDFHDYYSLGFVPPTGWDGGSHSIRVELVGDAARGSSLRYRRRYRAIPDDERLAERTLAALVLGWEDNPLGTEIRLGERQRAAGKSWLLPVEIVLPAGKLGTVPDRAGADQLVRVLMIAEDAKGRRSPMREKVIPLRHAESDVAGPEERTLIVNVELQAGVHTLAVAVRDEIHRTTSFHRITVDVGG